MKSADRETQTSTDDINVLEEKLRLRETQEGTIAQLRQIERLFSPRKRQFRPATDATYGRWESQSSAVINHSRKAPPPR